MDRSELSGITDGEKLLQAIEELGGIPLLPQDEPQDEIVVSHQPMTIKDSKGRDTPIDVKRIDLDAAVQQEYPNEEPEEEPQQDDEADRLQFQRDMAEAEYYARSYGIGDGAMKIEREPDPEHDFEPDEYTAEIEAKKTMEDVLRGDDIDIKYREMGRIDKYFSHAELKALFCFALSIRYSDNNQKADILKEYMTKKGFTCIGTGTNRIAFKKGQYVYKLPMDRRGIVDNLMEFMRAPQAEQYLAHAYESCGVVLVAEYADTIDLDEYTKQRDVILSVLNELSKEFIIGDMGYDAKDFMNTGVRRKPDGSRVLIFLDYAYMHTRRGNEKAFTCPVCGAPLGYNPEFTGYVCSNHQCNTKLDYRNILWRINSNWNNPENKLMAQIQDMQVEDMGIDLDI